MRGYKGEVKGKNSENNICNSCTFRVFGSDAGAEPHRAERAQNNRGSAGNCRGAGLCGMYTRAAHRDCFKTARGLFDWRIQAAFGKYFPGEQRDRALCGYGQRL